MFVVTLDVELFEISWQNISVADLHGLKGVSPSIDGSLEFITFHYFSLAFNSPNFPTKINN